jgi:hypothetical protein
VASTSFFANNPGRKIIWIGCTLNYHLDRVAITKSNGIANRLSTSFLGKFDAGGTIWLSTLPGIGVSLRSPNTLQAFDET